VQQAGLARAIADARHLRIVPEQRPRQSAAFVGCEGRTRLPGGLVHDDEIAADQPHVEQGLGLRLGCPVELGQHEHDLSGS